jgi:uncharacterized membrane protein
MSQFIIVAGDKKEYGPVSIEEVGRWIQQDRANGETQVQPEGETEWVPLRDVPELADLLGGTTPQTDPSGEPPVLGQTPLGAGPGIHLFPPTADQLMAELQGRPATFSVGECFSISWRLVMDNLGLMLLSFLCLMGINIVAGFIPFGGLIVGGPLMAGFYYIILKRLRGEAADLGNIFEGFKSAFWPLVLINLYIMLVAFVAYIPMIAVSLIGVVGGIAETRATDGLPIYTFIITGLGILISMVPILVLMGMFSMALPLTMDRRMDATEAFKATWRVTKKCWGQYLRLTLVVMLLFIAGTLALCLGWLITAPVSLAMFAVAYEKLFGRGVRA